MKKYKKIAYILLAIIIIASSTIIYAKMSSKDKKNNVEKTTSEVEFLEAKLVDLLNEMNNIEIRNYNISVSEISKQTKEQKSANSSSESDSSQSESNSNSTQGSNSEQGSSNSNDSSGNLGQGKEKFDLRVHGVLTNTDEIDWENIKGQIETLYSSLSTITLDLYQTEINKEDILGFNNEFDNLTIMVKEEKKEETLNELTKLYDYMPKFIKNEENSQIKKILLETKANIFKAYSKLDSKNWEEISNDVIQAINTYLQLLTNPNVEESKQYSISKVYIMINELQNAVQLQDKTVFLIKYKNILEEMNNL